MNNIKKLWNRLKEERGAVTVITAVSLTILLIISAFTTDLGLAYVQTSTSQNISDAVALSIESLIPVKSTDTAAIYTLKSKAKEYAIKNGFPDLQDADIILKDLQNGLYHTVTIKIRRSAPTSISKIIGINSIDVTKSATISATPAGGVRGAVPIGVRRDVIEASMSSGNTQNIELKYGGGDGDGGSYGFIILDNSNGNANILLQWFEYGYEEVTRVGDVLPQASGNKASVAKTGFDYRFSRCTHNYADGYGCNATHYAEDCPRVLPVLIYDVLPNGNVKVTGFAAFILSSVSSQGALFGSYVKMTLPSEGSPGTKDYGIYNVGMSE